jgi:hypothetical protein
MYNEFMIRTQIYLTPKQHSLLKKKAFEKNATISEEIRKILDKDLLTLDRDAQRKNIGAWLLSMASEAEKMEEKGPIDLASNVDKYLYGK